MRRLLLFIGLELLVISMAVLLVIFDISKIDNILFMGVPLILLIYILFGFKRPAFFQSGFAFVNIWIILSLVFAISGELIFKANPGLSKMLDTLSGIFNVIWVLMSILLFLLKGKVFRAKKRLTDS